MQIGCEKSTMSGKKTGCANDIMSAVMNERADNKRQEKEHGGPYDLWIKSFMLT